MRMREEIAGAPATAALGAEMLGLFVARRDVHQHGDDHRDLLLRTIRNL